MHPASCMPPFEGGRLDTIGLSNNRQPTPMGRLFFFRNDQNQGYDKRQCADRQPDTREHKRKCFCHGHATTPFL